MRPARGQTLLINVLISVFLTLTIETNHNDVKRHVEIDNRLNIDMLVKNGGLARCTRETVQQEGARLGNLGQD